MRDEKVLFMSSIEINDKRREKFFENSLAFHAMINRMVAKDSND